MSLPIGFFSPLPLPIMVPFMFMQSAAMALGFGSFFQYGKRKLSAMSNEEFNALTPEALTSQLMSSINNMIPTVEQSFHQMESMNVMILEAMAKYFSQGVEFLDKWIIGRGENFVANLQGGVDSLRVDNSDTQFLADFGIGAAATDGGAASATSVGSNTQAISAVEKYASRWIDVRRRTTNFNTITIDEARFLLDQFSKGSLPNMLFARKPLITKWESLQPVPKTLKDAPDVIKKTSGGDVQKIALMFNEIREIMSVVQKAKFLDNTTQRKVVKLISVFNQFVQSTRKSDGTTYRSMTIHVAKTVTFPFRIVLSFPNT